MKMKNIILVGAFSLGLGSSLLTTGNVFASNGTIYGGWSEDKGYFTNEGETIGSRLAASASPTHWAEKEYKTGGSVSYERVIGNTTWPSTYHYSRARYESALFGYIEADSGRVYGTGSSRAVSGWHTGDLDSVAHTYYGK